MVGLLTILVEMEVTKSEINSLQKYLADTNTDLFEFTPFKH